MKENSDLLKLGIPGLSASYNKNQTLSLKILWILMVITCTAICAKLIVDRILYFFTYPVVLSYEMNDNEFLKFPKATFCPKDTRAVNCSTEITYAHLWDDLDEPFSKLFELCATSEGKTDCLKDKYWSKHETVYGNAYTFDLANNTSINPWFIYLGTSKMEIKNYKVLLHEDDLDISYGCAKATYPVSKDLISIFIFSKSQVLYEDVPPRPCQSITEYKKCINHCSHLELIKDKTCKLPFMKSIDHLPLCQTCEQMSDIYENFNGSTLHSTKTSCNCTRPCEENRYDIDLDTRELFTNQTQFVIFLPRDDIEFLREKRSYVLYALICEIGGIIGLYLGACLLTFIEIVEVGFTAVYKRIVKPVGKPFVRIRIEIEANKITRRYVNYAETR